MMQTKNCGQQNENASEKGFEHNRDGDQASRAL
jgi:hypothetical protein